MRTQRTILLIVGGVAAFVALDVVALVVVLGWAGAALFAGAAVVAAVVGRTVAGPWHRRWGATHDEVAAPLPGDDLLQGAVATTTRAVTVAAPPVAVWPWLVQLGFGRAGWYSYDWIDNDGLPSAEVIVPEWQDLGVGDTILMTPDRGFEVRAVDPGRSIVSQAPDGTTWCLSVEDGPDGTARLVSRFRAPRAPGVAGRLWMLLAGPGGFVMERRMLLGIRDRAERLGAGRCVPS